MPFLTAQWRNLILANYVVDPALLQEHVPTGVELDFHEGQCFVSLVGFQFLDTRVLGVKWPGLHTFCELNLRFYVKRTTPEGELRRGVVFIKEIVPSRIISFVARTLYHEPYEAWPLQEIENFGNGNRYGYEWGRGEIQYRLEVRTAGEPRPLPENSHEQFIAEHYWGYTKLPGNRTNEYEVQHPSWEFEEVNNFTIDCDFAQVYDPKWAFLTTTKPYSIFLAQGSQISVAAAGSLV